MATHFSLAKAHSIASQSGETVHDGNGTYTSTVDGWSFRVVPRRRWDCDAYVIYVHDETGEYVSTLGDYAKEEHEEHAERDRDEQ